MSSKITSNASSIAFTNTGEVSAAADTLAEAIGQSAANKALPAAHEPRGADTITWGGDGDDIAELIKQQGLAGPRPPNPNAPGATPAMSLAELMARMDLPSTSYQPGIIGGTPSNAEVMLASAPLAAGGPSAQLALGAQPFPAAMPHEINQLKDNLAAQLSPDAGKTQLIRELPAALNAAGLDSFKTDAACALGLRDALSNPVRLHDTLTRALERCPAFKNLSAAEQQEVIKAAASHVEAKFTSATCGLIKAEVVGHINGAKAVFEAVNKNTSTRCAALEEIARRGPDAAAISQNLAKLGLNPRQCAALAPQLDTIGRDIRGSGFEGARAQESLKELAPTLQSALNTRCGQLDQLARMVSNDQVKNDRVLRSDLYSVARDSVLSRLEVKLPSADALEAAKARNEPLPTGPAGALANAILTGKKRDDHEANLIMAVGIVGSFASMGISSGLIGTIIAGAVGAAPDVTRSQSNLEATRGAHAIRIAEESAVERAGGDRDKAIALAVVSVLIDVGGGAAVEQLADLKKPAHIPAPIQTGAQELIKFGTNKTTDHLLNK